MKRTFRNTIVALLVLALVIGTMTGCKKNQKPDNGNDETVTTATPIPEAEPTKEAPAPTEEPAVTDVPDTDNSDSTDVAVNIPDEGGNTASDGVHIYGPALEEDPSKDDNWNYIVREFNAFLNGEEAASNANRVTSFCKLGEDFNLGEIAEGLRLELNNMFIDQNWILQSIGYSLIDCGYDGVPELAVMLTYEESRGFDLPYEEIIIFSCDYGWVFVDDAFTNYYREFTTVNKAGYCINGGSSGANLSSSAYYYVHDCYSAFMRSEYDYFGAAELKLPQILLPSDTKLTNWSDAYSDPGYTVERVSLKENDYIDTESYDRYVRDCYYVFMDFDGNYVMPDADYVAECAADGIQIISGEELERIIAEKEELHGLTEEIKNAPLIEYEDWIPAPEGAWNIGNRIFRNFQIIADNMDMWLESDPGDYYVSYAISDMDFNRRYEVIRAEMDFWTGEQFYTFYEVNDDRTGLIKLDYEEQFTVDGEVSGDQPDIINAEEIREYSGNGGRYYYVFPTAFYYDTFAESLAVNRNLVLSKKNDEHSIVYEGYSGGVDWYTVYDPEGATGIQSEGAKYYRWDDKEITEEEYASINKAFFDFDPDGYNIMHFGFIPMMVGLEDDRETCYAEIIESFMEWGGGYVYSPDGK